MTLPALQPSPPSPHAPALPALAASPQEHETWPHVLRHRSEEQSAKKEEMVQQRVFGRNLEIAKPRMAEAGSAKQQIRHSKRAVRKTMIATLKAALSKATVARWIWARVGSIVGWVQ